MPAQPSNVMRFKRPAPAASQPGEDIILANIEAEQWTLGAILNDPPAVHQVAPFLRPDHFYRETHGWIYQAMLRVTERGQACDPLMVKDELARMGKMEEVGGGIYLRQLCNQLGTWVSLPQYAELVMETAIKRAVLRAAEAAAEAAYDRKATGGEVLERAMHALLEVKQPQTRGLQHVAAAIDEWTRQEDAGTPPGLPTGFSDLDRPLGGLKPGRLYVIGARPGVGKSALAKDFARAFLHRGQRVAYFSLEMGAIEVSQRIIAAETRIDLKRVEEGGLGDDEYVALYRAKAWLSTAPLWIDDSGELSPLELRTAVQREHLQTPLSLVVVDYIQRLYVPGVEGNRVQEVGRISRALKALARDLGVPVVALSSFNRAVEYRGKDSEPTMADLRESGDIESDADAVLLMWPAADKPNVVNVKLAKQRNGPMGVSAELYFDKATVRFENLINEGVRP